jgi:hypothetical protein
MITFGWYFRGEQRGSWARRCVALASIDQGRPRSWTSLMSRSLSPARGKSWYARLPRRLTSSFQPPVETDEDDEVAAVFVFDREPTIKIDGPAALDLYPTLCSRRGVRCDEVVAGEVGLRLERSHAVDEQPAKYEELGSLRFEPRVTARSCHPGCQSSFAGCVTSRRIRRFPIPTSPVAAVPVTRRRHVNQGALRLPGL